jgi:hypothetical protein
MLPGMKTKSARYRQPTPDEQQVLTHLIVRPVRPEEGAYFDQLIVEHHYLRSARVVGEQVRYVATYQDQWLALATWNAPALHLKARDAFIGWTEEQRRSRLPLLINNSRLLVLPECHYPNLISRFMKLMLARLSDDWQQSWGHPLALAETFVDPHLYQGTAYKASGWHRLGPTAGWKRSAEDFYQKHDQPKQIWVRELLPDACRRLCAPQLPPDWATVEQRVGPRCTARAPQMRSLVEHLRAEVPEFRSKEALAYPIAGFLGLIALAMFSGVRRGPQDLAEYAATLSQGQLRALGFRTNGGTGRVRCPGESTFKRVLPQVAAPALERALLLWQEQVLGPFAGQAGDCGRQEPASRARRTGQRRQWPGPLAGHRGRPAKEQRDSSRAGAVGQSGVARQNRSGRRLAHASGDRPTSPLRGRRRLLDDRQGKPEKTGPNPGDTLDAGEIFPLGPRRRAAR